MNPTSNSIDLVSEQETARLIEHRDLIIRGALINFNGEMLPIDEETARHITGATLASDVCDYFQIVHEKAENGDLAIAGTLAKLRDKALQLEAFHLQQLDAAAH